MPPYMLRINTHPGVIKISRPPPSFVVWPPVHPGTSRVFRHGKNPYRVTLSKDGARLRAFGKTVKGEKNRPWREIPASKIAADPTLADITAIIADFERRRIE